jgi:hypothetical protein
MAQEEPHPLSPQNALAKFVRERIEKRKYCMVFERQLEHCWPAEKVKTAARIAREEKIRGLSVIFKKMTA